MFYATFVLSKKGPLAKVWLAAHWEKKVTKAQVFETDVQKTVDDIISPRVKLALRTSGHLLLGIVRIYSRKQKYLIQDLGEACAKIKMAFRPGAVDLPSEGGVTTSDTITLPEILQSLESAVADLGATDFQEDKFQSRAEDITLKDDVTNLNNMLSLNDFEGMGAVDNDEFGGVLQEFEMQRDEAETNITDTSHQQQAEVSGGIEPAEPKRQRNDITEFGHGGLVNIDEAEFDGIAEASVEGVAQEQQQQEPMETESILPAQEVTTGEEKDFVLPPVDATLQGMNKQRQKRKRKLLIDKEKELRGDIIRAQLMDYSDTLRTVSYPPPTKKMMLSRLGQGHDFLFQNPTWLSSSPLSSLVTRNLHLLPADTEVPLMDETVEMQREKNPSIIGGGGEGAPVDMDAGPLPIEEPIHGNDDNPFLPPMQDQDEDESISRVVPNIPDFEEAETEATPTTETPEAVVEEKKWNKRTQQVLRQLEKGFQQTDSLHFSDIARKCNRKQAASRFYSCLLLAKEGAIKLEQSKPYAAIVITDSSITPN
ncbi:PREDICTED: double-strand-break repair protein rad21 homolog [Amphimedon queenslandica]|uniref:Rad21/Rec8-like protein N-terminal domain-containing protein n=1 Tax=Amphimedon queenslandica TaxID=400682 RepID=A0A1X7UB52_AMPQE|nr:PREDICTED: double-strand-break repair protein rad21 homolog [Amphimedon queenslandica]|eukprot:XP_003388470.1 PREDICTED: double-strand-break repair protein rad21 homolog [Amphimedon queenslandica]